MKRKLYLAVCMALSTLAAGATPVMVTMNTVSTKMSIAAKGGGTPVEAGEPAGTVYTFDLPAGEYVLTAYAKDGTTVNGTIEIAVAESQEVQEFKILTCTAYVTNKNEGGSTWSIDKGDYTLDVAVRNKDGEAQSITIGNSVTEGRNTFLALNGYSYRASFIPSEAHRREGYITFFKAGTVTFNANVNGAIPMSCDYSICVPAEANLFLGMKFAHFTDFTAVEPKNVETTGDTKTFTYSLAAGQVYNYRTWMAGGLTRAGYFTMNADEAKRPELNFVTADYQAYNPKQVNHSVESNNGYETGDILVNINARGHLAMNVGDVFVAHAMRSWELTDNSTSNYFIEPDFHYSIITPDGKTSTGVIEIENNNASSSWANIKAVGPGTAIVLVTYDAIGLNYYSGADKKEYLGGEYWGAIWPENTGVYVVTVGENAEGIETGMYINDAETNGASKLAGAYIDAELDVIYYLDSTEGAEYTFTPKGVATVEIACPTIGEHTVSYAGFSSEGVSKGTDGSYTVLLHHGRNIIRLTDAAGKSVYQIITAKKCHREITNLTRKGSHTFKPGETVMIQYSGLFHPANKLAGIYNMSAFATYTVIPEGTSLTLGSSQYTFASTPAAQAVTIDIPEDFDASTDFVLEKGAIQLKGYGDPVGSHRSIYPTAGRSPNFTAISHTTVLGSLPEVRITMESTPTDIENISVDESTSAIYYNLEGLSSEQPFKGFNIVRYPTGTSKKIYVK